METEQKEAERDRNEGGEKRKAKHELSSTPRYAQESTLEEQSIMKPSGHESDESGEQVKLVTHAKMNLPQIVDPVRRWRRVKEHNVRKIEEE